MAEIDIYAENSLLDEIARVARRQYGDDSEASVGRVVETALEMRILWSGSITRGQDETEEAVSKWQFPESAATADDENDIRQWIFRRQ